MTETGKIKRKKDKKFEKRKKKGRKKGKNGTNNRLETCRQKERIRYREELMQNPSVLGSSASPVHSGGSDGIRQGGRRRASRRMRRLRPTSTSQAADLTPWHIWLGDQELRSLSP